MSMTKDEYTNRLIAEQETLMQEFPSLASEHPELLNCTCADHEALRMILPKLLDKQRVKEAIGPLKAAAEFCSHDMIRKRIEEIEQELRL